MSQTTPSTGRTGRPPLVPVVVPYTAASAWQSVHIQRSLPSTVVELPHSSTSLPADPPSVVGPPTKQRQKRHKSAATTNTPPAPATSPSPPPASAWRFEWQVDPHALLEYQQKLAELLAHVCAPHTPRLGWKAYVQQLRVDGKPGLDREPGLALLYKWLRGEFPEQVNFSDLQHMNFVNEVPLLTVPYWNENRELPANWYVSWNELSPLGQLYCLQCVESSVASELAVEKASGSAEKPQLWVWELQFLLVALLKWPEDMLDLVQSVLRRMGDLTRWQENKRYNFSGGFFREELFNDLKFVDPTKPFIVTARLQRLVESFDLLFRHSDGVAFYEHVDNFDSQHPLLPAAHPFKALLERPLPNSGSATLQRTDFFQRAYAVTAGVPSRVVDVEDYTVKFKYHGWPGFVTRARTSLSAHEAEVFKKWQAEQEVFKPQRPAEPQESSSSSAAYFAPFDFPLFEPVTASATSSSSSSSSSCSSSSSSCSASSSSSSLANMLARQQLSPLQFPTEVDEWEPFPLLSPPPQPQPDEELTFTIS